MWMTRVSRTWLTAGISVVQLFHNTDDIVAAKIDILSMESIHYLDRDMFDVCAIVRLSRRGVDGWMDG